MRLAPVQAKSESCRRRLTRVRPEAAIQAGMQSLSLRASQPVETGDDQPPPDGAGYSGAPLDRALSCLHRHRESAATADPAMAHERAIRAARARNSPDSYIRSLERAELTAPRKHRLALLVLSFGVGGTEDVDGRDDTTAGVQ